MLTPDPREVVRVFDVPLSELLDPDGVYREERWDMAMQDLDVHFYELDRRDGVGRDGAHPDDASSPRSSLIAEPCTLVTCACVAASTCRFPQPEREPE